MTFVIDSASHKATRYSRTRDGRPLLIVPVGIVLHSCEGTRHSSIPWLTTDPRSTVSCTYYVQRDGIIFQFAPDNYRTYHAGECDYLGIKDWNRAIGVEAEHKQGQDWPSVQKAALAWLFRLLITRHQFPRERIVAHRWPAVPPGRKQDPTDWGDANLRAWIGQLYTSLEDVMKVIETFPAPRRYQLTDAANIRRDANRSQAPSITLPAGTTLYMTRIVEGEAVGTDKRWLDVSGAGFVHASIAELAPEAAAQPEPTGAVLGRIEPHAYKIIDDVQALLASIDIEKRKLNG